MLKTNYWYTTVLHVNFDIEFKIGTALKLSYYDNTHNLC